MDLRQLEALEAEQTRDMRAVEDGVTKALQKLSAINRDLKFDIVQQQEAAVREAAAGELAGRRAKMLERAELVTAGQHQVSREALLRKARFSDNAAEDATIRASRFTTLSETPTVALVSYLEDAIAAGDVAGAEVVRVEFQSRSDADLEAKRRFAGLFDKVAVPGADEAATRVQRTVGLAEMATVKLSKLARGHSDPMKRLAAFRMIGGGRPT